jgi:hypothetical protein
MTTEELSRGDLPFGPDFAGRVLNEAGRIAARRRRITRASVLAAAVAVTGAFGLWRVVGSRAPKPAPIVAENSGYASDAVAQSAQTEPLDYMFPEATPLAQFADAYSGAVSGATAARQNILFAGETGQDSDQDEEAVILRAPPIRRR